MCVWMYSTNLFLQFTHLQFWWAIPMLLLTSLLNVDQPLILSTEIIFEKKEATGSHGVPCAFSIYLISINFVVFSSPFEKNLVNAFYAPTSMELRSQSNNVGSGQPVAGRGEGALPLASIPRREHTPSVFSGKTHHLDFTRRLKRWSLNVGEVYNLLRKGRKHSKALHFDRYFPKHISL